jgi:general secretion pathway protein G
MKTIRRARRQGGFTIFEIVIVFILLAGIMAFVLPKVFEQASKAKSKEAEVKLMSLAGQIEMYKLEVGRYPENLQALVRQPAGAEKWAGPYAKDPDLRDAWGNEYRYQTPGQGKGFDLVSYGADGKEGGDGENRDLRN